MQNYFGVIILVFLNPMVFASHDPGCDPDVVDPVLIQETEETMVTKKW